MQIKSEYTNLFVVGTLYKTASDINSLGSVNELVRYFAIVRRWEKNRCIALFTLLTLKVGFILVILNQNFWGTSFHVGHSYFRISLITSLSCWIWKWIVRLILKVSNLIAVVDKKLVLFPSCTLFLYMCLQEKVG